MNWSYRYFKHTRGQGAQWIILLVDLSQSLNCRNGINKPVTVRVPDNLVVQTYIITFYLFKINKKKLNKINFPKIITVSTKLYIYTTKFTKH